MNRPTRDHRSATLSITLAVILAVALSACGGGREPSSAANYVAFEDVEVGDDLTVTSTAARSGVDAAQATPDYEYVEGLIQDFLDLRTDVILHDAEPADLASHAGTAAIAAVVAERDKNDGYVAQDYISAVDRLAAWPNITSIEFVDGGFRVRDCTERQEVNAGGQYHLWFVDRTYTLSPATPADPGSDSDPANLIVSDFTTLHNGFLEPDKRFGCVPQSFAERAETTATAAWSEVIRAARNPAEAGEPSAIFGDDLAASLQESISEQAAQQLALESAESVAFTSIGVDTGAGFLQFDTETSAVVVVESCRYFPTGLTYVDDDSGAVTMLATPNSEYVQWIYVQLPTTYSSDRPDQVVRIEDYPDLTCGERP